MILALQDPFISPDTADQFETVVQEAVKTLKAAVAQRPEDGDSHAMLATLYGMRISRRPLTAVWLGPLVQKHLKAAKIAGPDNPRVRYLEGAGALNRARDSHAISTALDILLQAERLFAEETFAPKTSWDADWGRPQNLIFIGEAYEKLDNSEEAMIWYERALRASPTSSRAKKGYERCRKKMENH